MPKVKYPSVSEAAAQILRDVEAERTVKTAELQILRETIDGPKTEVAQGLNKLASALRGVNVDDPEVNYTDLQNFIKAANAR
jgi:hypothetical protein